MELWQTGDEDDPRPGRLDEIEEEMSRLDDRDEIWPPETLAIAGAAVAISHDGKTSTERGLVRPEDMPKPTPKAKAADGQDAAGEGDESPSLSAALIESLSAQRSAALAAELLERPDVALAAVVHAFAAKIVLGERSAVSSLERLIFTAPSSYVRTYHGLASRGRP